MANTAKSKKAKGVRFEKVIAEMIKDTLNIHAEKMPNSGQNKGFESDIFTDLPLSIECKNHENWKLHEWWKQTTHDAELNKKIPALAMSRNRLKDPLVVLNFRDLLTIIKYALKGGWKNESN